MEEILWNLKNPREQNEGEDLKKLGRDTDEYRHLGFVYALLGLLLYAYEILRNKTG